MHFLYRQKEMSVNLMRHPEVKQFVSTTASVLNKAVDEGIRTTPPSDKMAENLKNSNLVFSGFKTFHQLNEAFPSLLDADGNRKPFEQFLKEVQTVDETYNSQYLKAEYNFAVASAQMAAKWEKFAADGDRYHLQYRTAGDDKVRDSHDKLRNITLPVSSPFWDEYFPPNGWGCRCTVVQVRKSKYPVSNEQDALNKGSQATAGKHQELFRFNPGKQQACYPAYNPYTIKKCTTCSKNSFKLARVPDNELCAACKVIRQMKDEREKARQQYEAYDEKKWRKAHFDQANGGYLVTEESRQAYGNRNKQEKAKYDKEHEMCLTYARAGYRVEHLGETPGVSSPDVLINGIPADLKRTKGGGNIVKYAKKAISKQGAEMVLFQFDEMNADVYKELHQLQQMGIHGKYFVTGEDRIGTF